MEEAQDDIRRHIAAWRTAHEFLERERAERLRAMTDDECRAIIARIFAGGRRGQGADFRAGRAAAALPQVAMSAAGGIFAAAREVQESSGGEEIAVARRLALLFETRIPDAVAFSAQSRVFLAKASDGTPLDVAFAGIEFERRCLDRATDFDFGGASLATCSAEDLVVMKVFAGRDQDWVDVGAILARQGAALDFGLVERELAPLLRIKEDATSLDRLRAIRSRS